MIPLPPICHGMLRTLSSTLLVALILVAVGCGGAATDPGTTPGTTITPPEALYGDWSYIGAILWSASNEIEARSSVHGEVYLRRDKTWNHSRYIGTIAASGDGTFAVKGDTLTLTHRDGSPDLVYTFALGSEADTAGGTRKTLVLTSMKVAGESWFHYALRERKE